MRTLLIGPGTGDGESDASTCRDALEAVLREQEHDVHAAAGAEDARAVWDEAPAPLIVLAEAAPGALAFCRSQRAAGDDPAGGGGQQQRLTPVVLAVASGEEARRRALDEAGDAVDNLIFSCGEADELRAHVVLARRQAERRMRALGHVRERREAERALRESEARARAVLETTVDGIITIDEEGQVESFNEAAEDIFGYAEGEVQGENIKVLMPEPYRSEHDSYLQSYHETGRRKIIGIGREVEGRRKSGDVFPMDLAVSEVELGERRLFTGVVRDISERRRLEREVLEISEEERRRIGQDLHDNLGQMLTGVGLLSRSLARKLEKEGAPGTDDAAEEAAKIAQLIKEADEQARTLSRGLVPVDLEAKGLADALRRLAGQTEALSEARCAFREAGTGAVHDNTAATHLFRIAQEATTNAVKHGRASHIAVMLASGPERIRLRVRDDGVGFPEKEAETHESQAGGLGVRTMHHRARLIGATLEIQSTPGEGTAVTCTLRPDRTGPSGPHHGSAPGARPSRNGAPRPPSGSAPAARPGAPGCPV